MVPFLATPLTRYLLGAMVGLALLAGAWGAGYLRGHRLAGLECEAAKAEALEAHIAERDRLEEAGRTLAAQVAEYRQQSTKRRVIYVRQANNLAPCGPVPAGLVRLHDAAASAADLPETPAGATCTSSAVGHDQFGAVLADNYARCNEYIKQLNSLISFEESR